LRNDFQQEWERQNLIKPFLPEILLEPICLFIYYESLVSFIDESQKEQNVKNPREKFLQLLRHTKLLTAEIKPGRCL
jgi:hypothetical protein